MIFRKKSHNSDFQMWARNVEQEKYNPAPRGNWWQQWSLRRKLLLIGITLAIVVVAVGLGAGLALRGGADEESDQAPARPLPSSATSDGLWKPTAGTTWNYKLLEPVDESEAAAQSDAEVWDIDLFNNDEEIINSLQSARKRIVCYFSAGTFENWRPDKDDFEQSDLGDTLEEWEGEKWLDTNSDNVRQIMRARLDMAVTKQCDGVEPDNVDAYDNENGLELSESDATDFVSFLADEAHSRNLSIALKNAGSIVRTVIDMVEYSVQEQCIEFDNCDQFQPFIEAGKPVFHVEYPKGDDTNSDESVPSETENSICDNSASAGFSTIIKNMNLDQWIESCSTKKSSRR